jgi:branched-chain amino acid transport system permease protein
MEQPWSQDHRARAALVAGTGVLVGIAIAFPWVFTNPTTTSIGVFTLIYMAAATAWNSFAGYSGYIPLGHAVFFGSGAYTLVIAAQDLHMRGGYAAFSFVALAGAVAAVVAIPFGLVALRTRRHTFVVITIAIFFIFQLMAFNLGITQGSSGIPAPTPTWPAATFNDRFYYVALAVLILAAALSWGIRRSRFGLQLLAIRDDEDRALSLGVRVSRVKLGAFVLSAVPVGMAGAVWAYFIGQVYPQFAFDPLFDISVALMAFLGGLGTVSGPLLGALILEPLQQYFTLQFSSNALYLVVYGALFLIVILLLPRGIIPTVRDRVVSWRERRSGSTALASGPDAAGGALSGGIEERGAVGAPGGAGTLPGPSQGASGSAVTRR